jgi:hypothetical protein
MHRIRRTVRLLLPSETTPPPSPPLPPILCLPREILAKCLEYALYIYDMHRRKPVALRHRKNIPSLPRRYKLLAAQRKAEDPYFPHGERAALLVCREFRLIGLELYHNMTHFLSDSDAHLRSFAAFLRPDLRHRLQHLVLNHHIFIRSDQPSSSRMPKPVRQRGPVAYAALTQFPSLRTVHFRVSVDLDPALASQLRHVPVMLDLLFNVVSLTLPKVLHMARYPASAPWPTHCVTHGSEGTPDEVFWEWNE